MGDLAKLFRLVFDWLLRMRHGSFIVDDRHDTLVTESHLASKRGIDT